MNIRQRILASGAIGIVAVVLLGGVGFWGQLRLGKALSENELSVNALRNHMEGDMMHDALRADVLAAFVVQPGDGAAAEQVRQDLQEHSQWFRKVVEQNQGLPLNDAIHQALVELRPDLEAYIGAAESIVGKALLDPVAARAELPQFVQAFKELEGRNEALSSLIEKHVEQTNRAREDSMRYSAWMLAGGILVACLVLGQLCRQLLGAVLQPLRKLVSSARVIAQGNLQEPIGVDSNDEAGQLQRALGEMQENLRQMITIIRQESEELHDTSQSIGQTSQSIVDGASQQADSATSMAASMEEMITNISQISDHADNARVISAKSEELASSGGQVILNVVEGMSRIADVVNQSSTSITALGQSSDEIHSIIQVIKGIAEQTNLLALNAAIEAARAGEAGRGFAVVADEVRGLAARTTQSTQEITAMIERIRASTGQAINSMEAGVSRVNEGVSFARQAGVSINEILDGARHAASVVDEISQTIREQSRASDEIAQRVELIAQRSQQNTQAMHEMAATARRLNEVAATMRSSVERFKI
ncbi:methyl-accepting chemotaxis (MCP) signaling domain protein [Pseudomonas aeruginosa c7447m]|uniref:methyl-accepting chemotaxis protein n=1 Tax=Pseudomonas aeruginosa TaxID=287 RepID=UPI0003B055C3|nr:methyl-accepting chemotaxis protein [Pseudomonas aeruginosa]AGV66595.1 methyl-accepting chemotaxis (MCP) signaling domain protein [Pseudomonas aeruginosa c7447m]